MIISQDILDELSSKAQQSERLRTNLDMRTSDKDCSQRNINAIEPGSIVAIHRHMNTSETCIILRGSLKSIWYDNDGNIIKEYILDADSGNLGISIPSGQWHSAQALREGTVFFEAKDGAYAPLSPSEILKK